MIQYGIEGRICLVRRTGRAAGRRPPRRTSRSSPAGDPPHQPPASRPRHGARGRRRRGGEVMTDIGSPAAASAAPSAMPSTRRRTRSASAIAACARRRSARPSSRASRSRRRISNGRAASRPSSRARPTWSAASARLRHAALQQLDAADDDSPDRRLARRAELGPSRGADGHRGAGRLVRRYRRPAGDVDRRRHSKGYEDLRERRSRPPNHQHPDHDTADLAATRVRARTRR